MYGNFSGNFNLIEDGSGSGLTGTVTGDPLLGPLADNGGPTQTHALLPGSPALDAGLALTTLDDYSADTFTSPNDFYNYRKLFNNPPDNAQVTGGVLNINVGNGAASQIWNQGESLQNVGDVISIDFGFDDTANLDNPNGNVNVSAGLALYDTVTGDNLLLEARVNTETPGNPSLFTFEDEPPGVNPIPINGTLFGLMNLQIRVTATTASSMDIETVLSGVGITPITSTKTLNVAQAFFGPTAFQRRRRRHGA